MTDNRDPILDCFGIDAPHRPTAKIESPNVFDILRSSEHFTYDEAPTVEYHLKQGGCEPSLIKRVLHALWFRDTLARAILAPPQSQQGQQRGASIDAPEMPGEGSSPPNTDKLLHSSVSTYDLTTTPKQHKNPKKMHLKKLSQRIVSFITQQQQPPPA